MLGQNNKDDPLIALALRWNIARDRDAKQNTVSQYSVMAVASSWFKQYKLKLLYSVSCL